MLPTAVAISTLGIWEVALTLAGFVAFYTVLALIEVGLMVRAIRKGPPASADVVGPSHIPSAKPAGLRGVVAAE